MVRLGRPVTGRWLAGQRRWYPNYLVTNADEGAWSTAMDEVKAMTHAGETVGKAVGTGLRNLRLGAVQVGQAGVEAVRDATAETQAEVVATTRRARKQLVKDARRTGKSAAKDARRTAKSAAKDLGRGSKRARKHAVRTARNAKGAANDLLAAAGPGRNKRRRWPWLLGIGVVTAGAAAAFAMKGQQETAPAPEQIEDRDKDRFATNGTAPHARPEQPMTDDPVNHRN
jgi:vacuolar-type H+-ATPase subunit H